MAKKSNKGKQAADARYADITPDELRRASESARSVAGQIEAVADCLERQRIEAIHTDGATKLSRGLETLDAFVRHIRKALIDAGVE